jgi:hypothetical protein
MAGETVRVEGGEQLNAYLAKVREGVLAWTDEPVYVGFSQKGSHGRLIERGFHPRGGSTFVAGKHMLEQARATALQGAKEAVIKSIEAGGPASLAAKKSLADKTAQQLRSSVPRRSGRLAGSVTIIVGGSGRGRR